MINEVFFLSSKVFYSTINRRGIFLYYHYNSAKNLESFFDDYQS